MSLAEAFSAPERTSFSTSHHPEFVRDIVEVRETLPELRHDVDSECDDHATQSSLLLAEDVNYGKIGGMPDIAKQHYEWAQELEYVDQKQADLVVLQWKLVRNQTGMLAQQLVDVRKQIQDFKREQENQANRVET